MSDVSSDNAYTCPVCHDDYQHPKILPCYHVACAGCVLSWLKKGEEGGCPLCRAPILPPSHPGQGDLTVLVDALPTDLLTSTLVKSHQILRGPHGCAVCPEGRAAVSYCFQCAVKVCAPCQGHHRAYPALKDHQLENLDTLCAEQLSARQTSQCHNHVDRAAELYCVSHQELICILCAATNHRGCPDMQVMEKVVKEKRKELGGVVCSLRAKEAKLLKQIQSRKNFLNTQRKNVKKIFDGLQDQLEKRRQELYDIIQKQEDDDAHLEKLRATVTAHALTMERMSTSFCGDAVLQMMKQLEPRTGAVEARCGEAEAMKPLEKFHFDQCVLSHMKGDLSWLGGKAALSTTSSSPPPEMGTGVEAFIRTSTPNREVLNTTTTAPTLTIATPAPATCPNIGHMGYGETLSSLRVGASNTARPTGEELARVLSVGDRVRASGSHPEFMAKGDRTHHTSCTKRLAALKSERVS